MTRLSDLPICCPELIRHWPLPQALPGAVLVSGHFDPLKLVNGDFQRCELQMPASIQRSVAKRQTEFLAGRLCAREAMRLELRAGDFEAAARLDFEFHRHILVASGNQAMLGIVTAGADIFLESQKMPFIRAARVMETWQEHRKILRALARHASGPAQKAMQDHIRGAALRTGIVFVSPAN
nr:FCD domain-containing protein [Pseudomonas syringae]